MRARLVRWALAAGLLAIEPGTAAHAESPEAELKAEFIERFTRFIDWEIDDLPSDQFVLCIDGESAIAGHLERIARRRKLRGRSATIEHLTDPADATECHV